MSRWHAKWKALHSHILRVELKYLFKLAQEEFLYVIYITSPSWTSENSMPQTQMDRNKLHCSVVASWSIVCANVCSIPNAQKKPHWLHMLLVGKQDLNGKGIRMKKVQQWCLVNSQIIRLTHESTAYLYAEQLSSWSVANSTYILPDDSMVCLMSS